ncbi:hypothetical protein trd_0759 [Thermomicrobium roseum DSM 5159]|uniref:Uncharacterized protein n=1 Tax=Thermomicrobium roseum (strain ATCC 27502 / DSM 5159 / P-2) TaxID=309801 RepID=B9KZ48_THERP|nr:hypothetical protein trd_0759 [Thermomicrobium roseum DSM 5159]
MRTVNPGSRAQRSTRRIEYTIVRLPSAFPIRDYTAEKMPYPDAF